METLLERETPSPIPTRQRSGEKRRFRRNFLIYLGVLAVIFAAALTVLWLSLAKYQKNVDAEAAAEAEVAAAAQAAADAIRRNRQDLQDAFLRFMEETDADGWADLYLQAVPPLEERSALCETLAGLIGADELVGYKADGWTPEKPVYAIYLGETPMARVEMEKNGDVWTVGKAEMLLRGSKTGSICVPTGCIVTCGETRLDETYISDSTLLYDFVQYADQLINPVYGEVYTVSGLLTEPSFSVIPPSGKSINDTGDGCRTLTLSETDAADYQAKAETLVKSLVYYYLSGNQNTGGNMASAAAHTVPGSQAHSVITGSYDGVIWTTSFLMKYSCEAKAGAVTVWADNCYSVDVDCKASGSNGSQEKTMDGAYRIYFLNTGSGFGIYVLETL